jgi:hypothetical protein
MQSIENFTYDGCSSSLTTNSVDSAAAPWFTAHVSEPSFHKIPLY